MTIGLPSEASFRFSCPRQEKISLMAFSIPTPRSSSVPTNPTTFSDTNSAPDFR